jgi:hypothetical protein
MSKSLHTEPGKTFSLSSIADEIRTNNGDYSKLHDDYTCLREYASDNSQYFNLTKIDENFMAGIGPEVKAFYTKIFETRKKILSVHASEAEARFTQIKALLANFPEDNPHVIEMKKLLGDSGYFIGLVQSMEGLHALINGYYKIKAEGKDGKSYIEKISNSLLGSLAAMSVCNPIPPGTFTEETKTFGEFLEHISALSSEMEEGKRTAIIDHFNLMMRSIVSCFVLYRTPVVVARGQNPIYLSRFISLMKLAPFLGMYGLNLGMFAIEA